MTEATADDPLVGIEHLAVIRNREAILDNVSLQIARHQLHVLVGPNGAGKSTLLSAILGLIPFSGRILLNWQASGAIGYVPQTFVVDATLPVTVEDFLALTRQRRPICLGLTRGARQTVHRLLERVALPEIARRPLAVLSGGELRRVLLAHALDPEPELLLLDEPTAGLDEGSAAWLEDTLKVIRQSGRTTVVMASHDLEQVRRLADRVTVLDRRVVAQGSTDTVLTKTGVLDLLPSQSPRAALR
ncbi:MAG: ATP-binding cassette domain-containing protein [Luteitalea sp.]|nr:ATP-binding cassette domain-containing protein [Luteitalea sp.]